MLDLGDLQVFSKIVETESLTKAGQALGLPKSTVQPPPFHASKKISASSCSTARRGRSR